MVCSTTSLDTSLLLADESPPDSCQVVKRPHSKGDNRRQVEFYAQPVANKGQQPGQQCISKQAGDERAIVIDNYYLP
jgi:hypothetical protein